MKDIKAKITKLLALAKSPEEHEAKSALLKARQLMAKHKLNEKDLDSPDNTEVIQALTGIKCSKRKYSWTESLGVLIAEHYCCKSYRHRKYRKQTVEVGLIGLKNDIEICKAILLYAYNYVVSQCETIWKANKGLYLISELTKITDAYGYGFVAGIGKAFEEQEQSYHGYKLALVTPPQVQAVVDTMKKAKKFKDIKIGNYDSFAYAGYNVGLKFDPSTKIDTGNPSNKEIQK